MIQNMALIHFDSVERNNNDEATKGDKAAIPIRNDAPLCECSNRSGSFYI